MPLQVPDQTIATQVKPVDAMTPLSSMLNIANGANQYQAGQQSLQANDMKLQAQTQGNNERLALQQFMSSPDNWQTNGTIDMQKLNTAVPKLAPMTGGDVLQSLSTLANAQTTANTAKTNMTTQQRGLFAGPMAVLGRAGVTDPKQYMAEFDQIAQMYPNDPNIVALANAYKTTLSQTPPGPHVSQTAVRAAESLLSPADAANAFTPRASLQSDGSALVPVVTTPSVNGQAPTVAATPGATPIPLTVPVGERQGVATDALGRQFVQKKDAQGNITTADLPTGGTQGGAQVLPTGETPDTLKLVQGIRANANGAAKSYPDQQFNTNQIIKLADETNPGRGADIVSGLRGQYAGIGATLGTATTSDAYNKLGHFMALQTAQMANASGLGGTDAGRAIAAEQAGNTNWTKEAIKSTARVNRALSSGSVLFNQGVENAITQNGNNQFAARDFQNRWANVANVDALRLYDAVKNRDQDPAGLTSLVAELGGPKSPRLAGIYNRVDAMRNLIKGNQ